MKKHLALLLFLLFSITQVQSQNRIIKGTIFGTDNKPVEDALVSVINSSDNAIFTSLSDSLGTYRLEGFFADSVYLETSTLYSKKIVLPLKLVPGENAIDTIYLEENLLDEVVVTASAYSVKRETDRLLMNINPQSNLIKNSNMWNAMRIIPTVSVTEFEGITMIGKKDVSIFINGRKSRMSSSSLKSYLESMPADNIKNIELIYNPGVAFDTGSNTGVINITLRKADGDGLKGMFTATMWQTHYNKQLGSLSLNYNKNNLSVISSFSGSNLRDWTGFKTQKEFLDTQQQIDEKGSRNNKRPVFTGNIDVSYTLNKKNKIGAVVNAEHINFHPNSLTTSSYKSIGSNEVDSVLSSSSKSDNKQLRIVNNLNYTYTNDNSSFKVDIDFVTDRTRENYTFETSDLNEIQSFYKQYYPQNTTMWVPKAEYNYSKGIHGVTAGIDGYLTKSDNKNEYRDIIKVSRPLPDNKFAYKEKSIAEFISYNITWNSKFSTKMGLRFVYTHTNGELLLPDKGSTTHSYKRLNPSVSLSYAPSTDHNVWYNMSVRDNFYKFTYLNPVKIYQSTNAYTTGNPDLKPSRTFSQDIGYSLKSMYTFRFGHNRTVKEMDIFGLPEVNSMIESKPLNYATVSNIYLVANTNRSFFNKQLYLNASLDGSYTHYKSKKPDIGTSSSVFNGRARLSGTYIPSRFKTWQMSSDVQYTSPFKTISLYYSSCLRGSIEISKRINDFSISMYGFYSLNYFDGRLSTKVVNNYKVKDYISHSVSKGESSGFMLSATYRFGNNKVRNATKRVTSSSSFKNRFNDNK